MRALWISKATPGNFSTTICRGDGLAKVDRTYGPPFIFALDFIEFFFGNAREEEDCLESRDASGPNSGSKRESLSSERVAR